MKSDSGSDGERYRSPLRAAQARATAAAVIAAGARLFVEHGYAATSVESIAAAAGVARATVFTAVGGKPVILKAAYDLATTGDDQVVSLRELPSAQRVARATTPHDLLAKYADLVTEVSIRLAQIHTVVRAAASVDAEAQDLWRQVQDNRRGGATRVVEMLLGMGSLREGLSPEMAADVICLFADPDIFHRLVLDQSWAVEAYTAMITEILQVQLLPRASAKSRLVDVDGVSAGQQQHERAFGVSGVVA